MFERGAGRRECVVRALVREMLLGPDLLHALDRLAEQLPVLLLEAGVRVGMELRPLVGPDAAPEPGLDPALGHVVEDGDVLGEADRVPPGGDVGHLADADVRRARRDVGAEQDGVGQVADPVRAEMVLADPHRVIAELLGEDALLAEIVDGRIGRVAIAGIVHGRKDRKAHVQCLQAARQRAFGGGGYSVYGKNGSAGPFASPPRSGGPCNVQHQ